jgi:FKBP-type peptidyl-prolyl cis-trans isomerase
MWLHRGEPVRWNGPWGLLDKDAHLEDDGTVLITDVRVDRVFLVAGLFYGIQGMNVGGTRVLRIAPQLAYGEQGIQGVIPPNAVLTAELSVIGERTAG